MIEDYRDEEWFKCLEYKWPKQAKFLDEAYFWIQNQNAFAVAVAIEIILRDNIQYIGEVKNKKELKISEYLPLHKQIEIIRKEKIVPNDISELMYSIRQRRNKILNNGRDKISQEIARVMLTEIQFYLMWFVDTYDDFNELNNKLKKYRGGNRYDSGI